MGRENVEQLIGYRKISLELIWWNDKGLKVSNDSIIEKDEIKYVIRNRAGYRDKIMVKILRSNQYYSIIENYTNDELKEMEYSVEDIKSMKTVKLYDEIILKPTSEMLQ